jgi:hypothetical protein
MALRIANSLSTDFPSKKHSFRGTLVEGIDYPLSVSPKGVQAFGLLRRVILTYLSGSIRETSSSLRSFMVQWTILIDLLCQRFFTGYLQAFVFEKVKYIFLEGWYLLLCCFPYYFNINAKIFVDNFIPHA